MLKHDEFVVYYTYISLEVVKLWGKEPYMNSLWVTYIFICAVKH